MSQFVETLNNNIVANAGMYMLVYIVCLTTCLIHVVCYSSFLRGHACLMTDFSV